MNTFVNHYEVLGLSENSDPNQIRDRFKDLAKKVRYQIVIKFDCNTLIASHISTVFNRSTLEYDMFD